MASSRTDPAPLSSGNSRVKQVRKLARRASRAEQRAFLADGPKAVAGALEVPGCVQEVFATTEATERYADLRAAAESAGVPWRPVEDRSLDSLSDAVTPAGVVARCGFVDRPVTDLLPTSVEEAEGRGRPETTPPRLVTICADVRDPGNAGTVIRTSDAAGADGVLLAGNSVDPYNPKAVRASVGSLFHLPIALAPDPAYAVACARAAGLLVLAADGAGDLDLDDATDSGLLARPTAWLFGNEAWGLPDELAALADRRVAIPIHGRAESLNLATAAAVCLYASARALR